VREYRPGDDLRRVHWRSTARLNRLVVREYDDEAARRVLIVLAGADHGSPPDSSFEALVSASASVALYAMGCGHVVEFVRAAHGGCERLVGPRPDELLDWLAQAVPEDASLVRLLEAMDNPAGDDTVVLFTATSGAAARSLAAAASAATDAVAVVADSSTWDETARGDVTVEDPARLPVRWLRRGEELRACLEH
jgi:uncharacterized protein (DUF58 family)